MSGRAEQIGERFGYISVLAGLILVAASLRIGYSFPRARLHGELVSSMDSDTFYHLRRLEFMAENQWLPPAKDWFAAAPTGLACPWPPGLEYLALITHGLLGSPGGTWGLLLIAQLLPVLIGIVAVLAMVMLVGREPWQRAIAGGWLAVEPTAVAVGGFAIFDYHGLELATHVVAIGLAAWASSRRWPKGLLAGAGLGLVGFMSGYGVYLTLVALMAGVVASGLLYHRIRYDAAEPWDPLPFSLGLLTRTSVAMSARSTGGIPCRFPWGS